MSLCATWGAYLADTLAGTVQLDRAARRELVARLDGEGLSTRVIAEVVGASDWTVRADVREVRGSSHLPGPRTGRDGKTYNPPAPKPTPHVEPSPNVDTDTGEIIDAEIVDGKT